MIWGCCSALLCYGGPSVVCTCPLTNSSTPTNYTTQLSGQGSCYLFRIDRYEIVDATMKGNLARFVNHCCDPCCYARIVSVDMGREDGRSEKKIVFMAKRDISPGEELTYDYHFAIEDEKVPCFCGAKACRGFMN